MKELTIKEKAKRYDEALERAKEINRKDIKLDPSITTYEYIFPELKESEDEKNEKVRIGLIKAFNTVGKSEWGGLNVQDILAWLEKQGESYTKRDVDDAFVKGMAFAKDELEKQGEQKSIWHNEDEEPKRGSLILLIMQSGTPIVAKIIEPNHTFNHGERWAYIDDLLEKQSEQILANSAKTCKNEQKPTDKVKPKFKVGDWIITPGNKVLQITSIEGTNYRFNNESHYWEICYCDEKCRLWTIQDAKDGDVLEFGDHGRLVSGIVSYVNKTTGKVDVNCLLENNNFKVGNYYNLDTIKPHPATKEQRDLLFQKMHEAGYEWDDEKKELKKIEQKQEENKRNLGEISSNWSEEDENEVAILEAYIRSKDWSESHIGRALGIVNELVNKCKSSKDRVQPKQEWSEEDEKILDSIIEDTMPCGECPDYPTNEEREYFYEGNRKVEWLKSLKKKIHLEAE